MTQTDYKVLFTALGFVAVVLGDEGVPENQAQRAKRFAQLIEFFCRQTVPEAFEGVCDAEG